MKTQVFKLACLIICLLTIVPNCHAGSNWNTVGKMPSLLNSFEGRSGVLEFQVVYPCSSGPAPMNIDAQFTALDEGSTERLVSV